MARAYYSTVLDHSADIVWSVIRRFDHYSWAGVPGETIIEDGRKGDQVASIRRFTYGGTTVRQILLAHSDIDRSYSYAFCDQPSMPAHHFSATISVTPVVDTDRAFVEWWATFGCAPDDHDRLVRQIESGGFAVWLGELRRFMESGDSRCENLVTRRHSGRQATLQKCVNLDMKTAHFSSEIAIPINALWAVVRDFGNYLLFTSGQGEAFVEGRRGDSVGAIRNATLNGNTVRQRLLAHSDIECFYTYEFCSEPPFPIKNYVATLQLKPIVANGSTFLKWTANFDASPAEREKIKKQLENSFCLWVSSLTKTVFDSLELDASS